MYDIYCGICHGNKGDGQGKLVQREKILGIPSYDDVGRAIKQEVFIILFIMVKNQWVLMQSIE